MRRKLLLLNLALLALAAVSGWQLRQRWQQARSREQAVIHKKLTPAPPQAEPPLEESQPLEAGAYLEVAQKMLFTRDRNPTVVIETEPPKPMPPLPVAHGVMDLGSGPTAILSEKAGAPQRAFRAGEQVGAFLLLEVHAKELVFEWEGQQIRRKIDELVAQNVPAPEPPAPAAATPAAAATLLAPSAQPGGPGIDVGGQARACQANDTTPAGTVSEGYRKVISDSPFGKICRWEQAK